MLMRKSLSILLQLFKTTAKAKWHLIKCCILHLPAAVVIENKQLLQKYMNQSFFDLCHRCQLENIEMLEIHLDIYIKN